ncbi:Amino Acid-Polyamine-Organocation (APC) Family [Thraustotheca clavata]|uniref:Amino Acid-Polyamine-Organocation (APC) Family n=1 Tax=Thraustotheca clavata TaxID=74557 RepID=A0A1V9ZCC3_9STRA|nr:Amino Acid-Polyamine-Organocation (APC) Family [Thraustotheca clavata]
MQPQAVKRITIVIGGQYFSWNAGLSAGIVSYAFAIALVGSAYICLILSMAEMTSTLAFSGGAYGLARCAIGFFAGWVIGCCEILEYIAYTSSSVMSLTNMIISAFPAFSMSYAPLLWFFTYAICNVLLMLSDGAFWRLNRVLAIVSIGLVIVYIVGSLKFISYSDIPSTSLSRGSAHGFLEALPVASWFFVGIEALNTMSDVVNNPKTIIPSGQIWCLFVLVLSAILVFIITIGLTPDIDSIITDIDVFNRGYQVMFNMSSANATMLSVPATFSTIFGFILAYSNIIAAMASSRLLPFILASKKRSACSKHPYATLVGSILGFGMCFLVDYFDTLRAELFNLCMTFAFTAYGAQCIGYVYLKHRFSHLPRAYNSPFGVVGAVYAFVVWMINLIAVLGFQENLLYKAQIVIAIFIMLTLYYFGHAKHHQKMSQDEQKVLFFAHVANANDSKRKRLRGNRTPTHSSTESISRAFDAIRAYASRKHNSERIVAVGALGLKISLGCQLSHWNTASSVDILGRVEYILVEGYMELEYVFYTKAINELDTNYLPIVWFGTLLIVTILHCSGGYLFWNLSYFFTIVSVCVIVLYCLSGINSLNIIDSISEQVSIYEIFLFYAKFFFGIECLGTFALYFTEPSVELFDISHFSNLLDNPKFVIGLQYFFSLSVQWSTVLIVPAIHQYMNVAANLAQSKLIPKQIGLIHLKYLINTNSIILCSSIPFTLCCSTQLFNELSRTLYLIALSFYLKQHHSQIEFPFHNPFGKVGVLYTTSVYLITLVGLFFFQNNIFDTYAMLNIDKVYRLKNQKYSFLLTLQKETKNDDDYINKRKLWL